MSNAVISPAGLGYGITGSSRVHAYVRLDLSGGTASGGEGEFVVQFPFTAAAPTVQLFHGADNYQLTFPPAVPSVPPGTFTGRTVTYAVAVAGPMRTLTVTIVDTTPTPSAADDWVLKIAGVPAGPAVTTATPSTNTAGLKVEADPYIEEPISVPATGFAGQTVILSGKARRNTAPLPAATDYNPPVPDLTWSQDPADATAAPVPPGATTLGSATVFSAAGYSATASFALPSLAASATLHYVFTATFGDFTATRSGTLQATALAHYWMIVLDRSKTMDSGTPTKWSNAKVTAQIWADVVSAFRYSATTPDRIGLIDFTDPSTTGFRAAPPASVDVRWPAAGAMGQLLAITDPSQNGFKVGGAPVLGVPVDQTPLGDALIKALDVMAATSTSNANFHYELLAVTDGIENTGAVKVDSMSTMGGASSAATFDTIKSSGTRSFYTYTPTGNVRIYPVGTGVSSASNGAVLTSLGAFGPSPSSIVNSVRDLFPNGPSPSVFNSLFSSLGATAQSVSASPPLNPDPAPVGAGQNVYFAVPNNETKLVVVVVWNNTAGTNALDLRFRTQQQPSPPNAFQAVTPSTALTIATRDTHVVAVVDLAQVTTAATEWRISYDTGGTAQPVVPADVFTGRDLHLRSAITFDRDVYYNDEPIVVTASAHAGGRPIPDARVVVELEGPALSEGELLASNSELAVPPEVPASGAGEGLHPASRDAFLARILASKKLPSFPTVHYSSVFVDGTNELHPDPAAGTGYYSNVFTKNWREGTYSFRVTISGRTPSGSAFSDVHAESRLVKVRTEDAFSKVAVANGLDGPTPGLRSARVRVTPKDALGQRLGPFRAGDVEFGTTRGAFLDAVESEFDGSYSQVLVYPARQVPVVTVKVQGRSLTPIVLSGGISGVVRSIMRSVLAWLVRSARHR